MVKGSPQAADVDAWLAGGQPLAASALAWTEFLSGPVTLIEVAQAEVVLGGRIIPFSQPEAVLAADLFNQTGRRRGSRFDCLIAATAILAGAEVATTNRSNFAPLQTHGLKLTASPTAAPPPSPPPPASE